MSMALCRVVGFRNPHEIPRALEHIGFGVVQGIQDHALVKSRQQSATIVGLAMVTISDWGAAAAAVQAVATQVGA